MPSNNIMLTPVKGYNVDNMVFSEPIANSITEGKVKLEFKRVAISTKYPDGTIGDLILPTERLFSFGVSENKAPGTDVVNGYTFPLCLWSMDHPTEAEKEWVEIFNKIVDKCIDHILDNKEELDLFEITRNDLTKMKGGLNPLYWKKEKFTNERGKPDLRVDPRYGPTLYSKLMYSKKNNSFVSEFYDVDDNPIKPLDLLDTKCFATCAIKIESIFIGTSVSLQIKLNDAVVEPLQSRNRRLIRNAIPAPMIEKSDSVDIMTSSSNPLTAMEEDDDDDYYDEPEIKKPATPLVSSSVSLSASATKKKTTKK